MRLLDLFLSLAAVAIVPRVMAEQWFCGTDPLTEFVSERAVYAIGGTEVHSAVNECCRVHDQCYHDKALQRAACDDNFCTCLNAGVDGVASLSNWQRDNLKKQLDKGMCNLVKKLGAPAYDGSSKSGLGSSIKNAFDWLTGKIFGIFQ